MKVFLLSSNNNMIREWCKYFSDMPLVEIIHDDFCHFMDIHHKEISCVVSPANSFGLMDGGYDLAISRWFGWDLMKKVQQYIIDNYHGEQPVGTSFLIETGTSNIKLIHTPTMREPSAIKDPLVVYQCTRTCLIEAQKHSVNNIVIPAFGGECGYLKHELIAKLMYEAYIQVNEVSQTQLTWGNHRRTEDILDYSSSYGKIHESEMRNIRNDYLRILVGDIVDDKILSQGDAVVLPTNPMMRFGSGVSGAIFRKAGVDVLEDYAMRKYGISYEDETKANEMKVGDVRVTPGFGIPCDIIWVQGPKVWEYDDYKTAEDLLMNTYINLLNFANEEGYSSILVPSIGTGSYGFEHRKVAGRVIKTINDCLEEFSEVNLNEQMAVNLVLFDNESANYYLKTIS